MAYQPIDISNAIAQQGSSPAYQPRDISAEIEQQQQTQQPSPVDISSARFQPSNWAQRGGADILAGLGQMGQGIVNFPHTVDSSIPAALPNYNYSSLMGIQNPNLADQVIQGAAKWSPAMLGAIAMPAVTAGGSLVSALGTAASQAVPFGIEGAMQNPDHPVKGGAEGFALAFGPNAALRGALMGGQAAASVGRSALASLSAPTTLQASLASATGNVSNLADETQVMAKNIMSDLSGGLSDTSKTPLEDTHKAIADGLQEFYKDAKTANGVKFDQVKDAIGGGDTQLFDPDIESAINSKQNLIGNLQKQDLISETSNNTGKIQQLQQDIDGLNAQSLNPANSGYFNAADQFSSDYSPAVKDAHDAYANNPTWDSYRDLSTKMGDDIGKLKTLQYKGNLQGSNRDALDAAIQGRGLLKQDAVNFIGQQSPEAQTLFDQANQHYIDNIAPIKENPKLSTIAAGKVSNPSNIVSLLKSPEEGLSNVVNSMPDQIKKNILYSELGKGGGIPNPQSLVNNTQTLDTKTLGSYTTPDFEDNITSLASKLDDLSGAKQQMSKIQDLLTKANQAKASTTGILKKIGWSALGALGLGGLHKIYR